MPPSFLTLKGFRILFQAALGYDLQVAQSLSVIYLHAVFSTKGRASWLSEPDYRRRVHAYLAGISDRLGCPPIEIGGVEDHVHALVRFGRTLTVSDYVKEVKRASSTFIKATHPAFTWQAGYGVFSVDPRNLDAVAAYIRNQEQHHKKVSFQDELRKIMAEHGLEWDERYFWD